jgi:hypothetical protein
VTAPDPDDPLVCINTRAAGGPATCEPNLGHCARCEMCKHACTCHKLTPLDKALLASALDAYAQHVGATNWKAFTDVVPQHVADNAYECTYAAVTPLLAEIRRLTASPDPARYPAARELVDAWNRRTDDEQLALADQFLERQQAALRCALGHCTTKEKP